MIIRRKRRRGKRDEENVDSKDEATDENAEDCSKVEHDLCLGWVG